MSKNSVLSRPRVSAAPSRHDFDRSFTCNFSQSNGMILPVFCEPVIAGTKGILNSRRFTRTKNVVFPAFQSVTQHVDFYAVPLRLLWSYWNDFKLNINDINFSNNIPYQSTLGSFTPPSLPSSVPWAYFNQDIISYFNNNTWLGSLDTRLRRCSDSIRLFDSLGYGDVLSINPGFDIQFAQSLFKLAAYQKVYYDHYRNTSYENNQPFAYNLDWLSMKTAGTVGRLAYESTNQTPSAIQSRNVFALLSELHYVNYRNDYFHNIYPSLNYSISQPSGNDWHLPSDVVGVSSLAYSPNFSSVGNQNIDVSSDPSISFSTYRTDAAGANQANLINPQQIRAMFALDKLMRASAYAPKHVKDQIEARFGVKVNPAKVSSESSYLGGFMNDIIFGEVTSTANTASAGNPSNLGEIGGKGIGSGDFSKDIEFYCEEDSLIIGVQYFLPRAQYDSIGSKAWNVKLTRNDFFQPEFEHLGLRPLYQKELNLRGSSAQWNNVVGYKEPNQEYKVGIDQNLGAFQTSMHMPALNDNEDSITQVLRQMELSAFVVHSATVQAYGVNPADYKYFKAYPEDLNSIFEEGYDGSVLTDQFYGNLRFKFAVNAPMSVHGNPIL